MSSPINTVVRFDIATKILWVPLTGVVFAFVALLLLTGPHP